MFYLPPSVLCCKDLSCTAFDKELLPRHRKTIRKEFSSLHIYRDKFIGSSHGHIDGQVDKEFSPHRRQTNRLLGNSYGFINRQGGKELLRSHRQRDYW
jgi:hypothetical protein